MENHKLEEKRLSILDAMDFEIWSNQLWHRLGEFQTDDVVTVYPNGNTTAGLKNHVEEMKSQFVWAPDSKITSHPIRFGSGDWYTVTSVVEGTFTNPMPDPAGGKPIQPTDKEFKWTMVTIAKFRGDKICEQHLFWDSAVVNKQLGLSV